MVLPPRRVLPVIPLPSERLRRALGGGRALFLVLLAWPVLLTSTSGPSMADSVLLAAIRLVNARTFTLSDGSDPERIFLTRAFDISVHDGRIYSGVGPGASVVAAPIYLVLKPVLALFGDGVIRNRRVLNYYLPNSRALGEPPAAHFKDMYLLQVLLVWVLVAPLYGWLATRLYRALLSRGTPPAQAAVTVLAAGLGSMLLYYSAMYSRQTLAYLLVWHALLSLWEGTTLTRRTCLLSGLALGLAVAVDYPSGLAVALGLAFTLPRLGSARRLDLLAPLVVAGAGVALYHALAFGSPLATPYQNRFWVSTEVAAARGLVAFEEGRRPTVNLPSVDVMAQLAFGLYKGIFIYSPILLVGLVGHVTALARTGRASRVHGLSLAVFASYLVFNSTLGTHVPQYGHHFWGGLSMLWGPRHLFAVLPFLAVGIAALDWRRASVRWACGLALLVSCALNVAGAMFSDVMMSTYAFGRDLRYPIGYALRLLTERGPRAPLLDAYGVDPRTQATMIVALALATLVVVVVSVSLETERQTR